MRINNILSKIIKDKNIKISDMSYGLYSGKKVNVSEKLQSSNMTINTILDFTNFLDYEVVLKPKNTDSQIYNIKVDQEDTGTFTTYISRNFENTKIRRVNSWKNQDWICLDDVCEYLKTKISALQLENVQHLIYIENGESNSLHLITYKQLIDEVLPLAWADDNLIKDMLLGHNFVDIHLISKE